MGYVLFFYVIVYYYGRAFVWAVAEQNQRDLVKYLLLAVVQRSSGQ